MENTRSTEYFVQSLISFNSRDKNFGSHPAGRGRALREGGFVHLIWKIF